MRRLFPLGALLLLVSSLALGGRPEVALDEPFRFTDVTGKVGMTRALHGAFTHAVAWGDFDGDGRLDLFLGTFADRGSYTKFGLKKPIVNTLFRQTADGTFVRFPSPAVEVAMRCSGAVFADLDNDGDLDLYVTSNRQEKPTGSDWQRAARGEGCRLYRNDGGGKFVDVSRESGTCPDTLLRCRDIGVLDFDGDGLLDLLVMQDRGVDPKPRLTRLSLFRNRGTFRFEDVSARVGLPDDLWGTGIAVADVNGDRRPDFFVCGCNRLFLSQPDATFKEARSLRSIFALPEKELDWVTGAVFGDLDGDGDLDLITGRHHYHGPSRIHVYLNDGIGEDGVPRFREVTRELGLSALPQKAPHPEIQDFDNDGIPDLYWSAFFAEGTKRRPFVCKGLGVKDGLPRFAVPRVPAFDLERVKTNEPPAKGVGMVYYVNSPAVDLDGDGRLDFLGGNWPPEGSRFYRNETKGGHWLQVRVEGKKMNRMGIGARVRVYRAGGRGETRALLGCQEITVNGGYGAARPALVHFGLGKVERCDVEVDLPTRREAVVTRDVKVDRVLTVREP